jgi:YfiH family protein
VAQHVFTTRQLPLRGGPALQPAAWRDATGAVGGAVERLVRVKQVHGADIRVLKRGLVNPDAASETPEADGIVSNEPDLVLSVQVADCVPLLMADRRTGAVAAVHAGWRGTCSGVARAAVETMVRELGSNPVDVVAAIGPSIGPCCYTVGENVLEAFHAHGATADETGKWFIRDGDGRWRLDLWSANRDQLVRSGLREDQIYVCGLCTQSHHELFESYRVDGERAGRMAGLIAVPSRA